MANLFFGSLGPLSSGTYVDCVPACLFPFFPPLPFLFPLPRNWSHEASSYPAQPSTPSPKGEEGGRKQNQEVPFIFLPPPSLLSNYCSRAQSPLSSISTSLLYFLTSISFSLTWVSSCRMVRRKINATAVAECEGPETRPDPETCLPLSGDFVFPPDLASYCRWALHRGGIRRRGQKKWFQPANQECWRRPRNGGPPKMRRPEKS